MDQLVLLYWVAQVGKVLFFVGTHILAFSFGHLVGYIECQRNK